MIDSHAHLTYRAIDRNALERAHIAGLEAIINICTDEDSLEKGLQLANECKKPRIYTVAATTPHDVEKETKSYFAKIQQALDQKLLIAIGETGLDYYYEHAPRDRQQEFLRRYLQLAKAYNLPVVIHCRDAFSDLFDIWDEIGSSLQGVLHCFTGTLDEAMQGIDRGLYVSFSGIVTFPKSTALQEVARKLPLSSLLIETDSPYLAPVPYRGKTNEPAFLVETAGMLAKLRDISFEEVVQATTQNTKTVFAI